MKKTPEKAPKKRLQDDSIRIRMMKSEHALLEQAAKRSGNKLAAWARDRLIRAARTELAQEKKS